MRPYEFKHDNQVTIVVANDRIEAINFFENRTGITIKGRLMSQKEIEGTEIGDALDMSYNQINAKLPFKLKY